MNANLILAVAAGGAAGSVARYLAMSGIGHWTGSGFPYGTLVVNVMGSFVMGALIELMALVWSPSQEMRALLTVGVLGGFTTFSTFSLDVVYLLERHQLAATALYVLASVVVSVLALFAGLGVVRQIVT